MKESVIYQDIIQKEALRLVNRILNRRFGKLKPSLLTFSQADELKAWLQQQEECLNDRTS